MTAWRSDGISGPRTTSTATTRRAKLGSARRRRRPHRRAEQLVLPTHRRGGRRDRAGRPRKPDSGVSHRARGPHARRFPLHLTWSVVRGLRSLRHRRLRKAIFRAIGAGADRHGLRVVHFSVQSNHLHMVAEALDHRALGRGMQGLGIRIAKAINRVLERKGTVFADRYHARALKTPLEVRNALRYVLQNARRHAPGPRPSLGYPGPGPGRALRARFEWVDPCSSALLFDGWSTGMFLAEGGCLADLVCEDGRPVVALARSWLLTTGWKRHGLLDPCSVPRAAPRTVARTAARAG